DAATLMAESENDRQYPYGEYHIFQDPVFKFQLFYDFKEQLLEQMASATSPHSSSLCSQRTKYTSKVWFQDVSVQIRDSICDSAAHSENLFESAMEKMDQVFGVMTSKMETVDEKIKSLKENIAHRAHRISQPGISQPEISQREISQPGISQDVEKGNRCSS
ncbi:hypothetical protein BGX20_006319, partial [Mortierella sp. AD010]